MFKRELMEFMDVEQLFAFMKHESLKTHRFVELPDGRIETWFEDYEVNEWVKQYEEIADAKSLPSTPA